MTFAVAAACVCERCLFVFAIEDSCHFIHFLHDTGGYARVRGGPLLSSFRACDTSSFRACERCTLLRLSVLYTTHHMLHDGNAYVYCVNERERDTQTRGGALKFEKSETSRRTAIG